jgi:cellulose synthase/poly-beta-1,6-N-acetylglucosamine synthase-like glycosyltransferase
MTTPAALAALALLVYTYAGYPLLLLLWSRLAPRSLRTRPDFEPSVSVCIAVHDGERYLRDKIRSLTELDYPPEKLEILLCSDGSTDGTVGLAHELALADPRIQVFSTAERRGKPSALNLLREQARGEVLLMTDVRQTLSPPSLRALLEPLADPGVGCVSGTLVLAGETGPSAYWRYERFIRSCEARRGSMVGVSGSLYAVRRDDFRELPCDVLLDDMFVPLSLVRWKKCTVLSDRALAFDEACDDEREFGRKVRTLAGNYQLVAKMPWLLVPGKNGLWFELVSHKLLRLICPWALLILFWGSGALAFDPTLPVAAALAWRALWSAQLLFYALALLGPRAGRAGVVARTFVVLNAAAVVGLWRFLRGSQAVTW